MAGAPASRSAGYGLVEVLAALAVLAIAATGTTQVLVGGLQRQAADRVAREAYAELRYRFEQGVPGEGDVALHAQTVAHWQVLERNRRLGRLAGVEVEWVDIEAEIAWVWRNAPQHRSLTRTRMRAVPDTRS